MTHTEKTELWRLIHEWRKQYELRVAGWPRVKSSPLALAEDAVNLHIAKLCHTAHIEGMKEQEALNV